MEEPRRSYADEDFNLCMAVISSFSVTTSETIQNLGELFRSNSRKIARLEERIDKLETKVFALIGLAIGLLVAYVRLLLE